jgi:predicted esterase
MNNDIDYLPSDEHKYTLILLHGMNTSNKSLFSLTDQIHENNKNIKICLPNAPKRTITWPTGVEYGINSWYNYFTCYDGLMKHDEIDILHFSEQVKRIYKIMDKETKILNGKSENIIIGGVSQGGTVALHVGLNYSKKIGGVIGIHTTLMDNITHVTNQSQKFPIYLFSGAKDNIYNIKLQNQSLRELRELKYRIFWQVERKLGHCKYSKKENMFIIDSIKGIL